MSLRTAKCKQCRREGEKLFLKGERCNTQKCAMVRRATLPGKNPKDRIAKLSEFGKQLREKQKAKKIFGISEKVFRNYYAKASKLKDGAIVLNLGRGGIINEDAVAKIIDERNLYFALDVLSQEPMKKDHPLLSITNQDRLYITPHIAWTSVEARDKLIASVVKNVLSLK
jgi:hypothetical protein